MIKMRLKNYPICSIISTICGDVESASVRGAVVRARTAFFTGQRYGSAGIEY